MQGLHLSEGLEHHFVSANGTFVVQHHGVLVLNLLSLKADFELPEYKINLNLKGFPISPIHGVNIVLDELVFRFTSGENDLKFNDQTIQNCFPPTLGRSLLHMAHSFLWHRICKLNIWLLNFNIYNNLPSSWLSRYDKLGGCTLQQRTPRNFIVEKARWRSMSRAACVVGIPKISRFTDFFEHSVFLKVG